MTNRHLKADAEILVLFVVHFLKVLTEQLFFQRYVLGCAVSYFPIANLATFMNFLIS